MRKSGNWMELIDDRILETLNSESWSTPHFLSFDIDIAASENRIYERCEVLRRAGFLEREYGNNYEISTWGALYLDGEVSGKDRRPLPAPRPPEAVRPGWYAGFG
ncbi:hypothetical protein JCM30237_12180 [Halolamina litorea]